MKTVDYLLEALKHHGGRADGFLTDQPVGIKLAEDDIVRVRYDAQTMRWIANRPSRIKYPTAKQLIKQYRREYAEKWG
ncbi:MAG: hypothetical protein AAB116_24105 [Candidatus Poribacteria bacterium]